MRKYKFCELASKQKTIKYFRQRDASDMPQRKIMEHIGCVPTRKTYILSVLHDDDPRRIYKFCISRLLQRLWLGPSGRKTIFHAGEVSSGECAPPNSYSAHPLARKCIKCIQSQKSQIYDYFPFSAKTSSHNGRCSGRMCRHYLINNRRIRIIARSSVKQSCKCSVDSGGWPVGCKVFAV